MLVNKENVARVIEYTENLTRSWVSQGNISKFGAQADPRAKYSFQKFLYDNNLLNNAIQRMDDVVIECPFHDDETPSCSINEFKGVFNCFSCGRHGNYINFIKEYDNVVLGHSIGFYQKVNDLLRDDPIMQAELGIKSIYGGKEDYFKLEDAMKKFQPSIKKDSHRVTNYVKLISVLQEKKCSFKELKFAILLMQKGITPMEIYHEIFNNSVVEKEEHVIDLQKLLI